jgi:DNA-binding NarL/FixJ family response regulator
MNKISIYIIDDHKLFVEGIKALLSDEPEFEITGYSLSAKDFLDCMDEIDAQVYLMDINMPDITGIELAGILLQKKPEAKILALTMYDEFEFVEKMIKSGVRGYILKTANLEELSLAIKTISSGYKFFGNEIQNIVFNKYGGLQELYENRKREEENVNITPREKEIISLIAKEFTTQEIAEKLFISVRTVETHRKNIISKTKTKSVVGLIKYAVKHGVISYDKF